MSTPENTDCESTMKPGKIGWAELITSDPEGAMAYYTGLFGWETEPFAASEVGYTMFKLDGVPFGGVMKTPMPGVPTHWLNYVSVADIEASIATSTGMGGEVVVPPMEVPTVGRIAVVKDPQGAVIGLHQRA
jgi:predicted enzyme related to lactoylglutathione lyase